MSNINWKFVQENSDKILADGVFILASQSYQNLSTIPHNGFGNYLISLDKKPFYVGEAKEILKRLKQQFKPSTSTFFKNYQKYLSQNSSAKFKDIDNFRVQFIKTDIGRKEIEEFGIVNLPTILNKFQLGKRLKCKICSHRELWLEVQAKKQILLLQGEQELFSAPFTTWLNCRVDTTAGLYVVKDEKDSIIYIGESSDIYERYSTHSSTTYFSALRRHIATDILEFELKEKNGKKKYLTPVEDTSVSKYLKSCSATFHRVNFGRYELEEYLIKKYRPVLNRKDNKD